MAKQDADPPAWEKGMGDGCSGVLDLGFTAACDRHDKKYHYGGNVEDKLIADGEFYDDMVETPGFWGWIARHGVARIRYTGVRFTTYNYPPNHSHRSDGAYIEAFNWKGPGRQAMLIDDLRKRHQSQDD